MQELTTHQLQDLTGGGDFRQAVANLKSETCEEIRQIISGVTQASQTVVAAAKEVFGELTAFLGDEKEN